mgnify:CR=1 FL=1
MIGECRIIRCFHGRYAADHRAGCIVEGDAGGNGGIAVTQADSNPCGAAVDVGGDEIVLDALFRSVQQVDITENAVHAEHILIFHVAAIAPFQHKDRQMVDAVLQKLRYIELACGMGDLTVPDKLTVEPDVEAGGNALKIQKCTRGSGILLVGEVVEVSAAGVLFRNIRWISGERIADVGVLFDFGKIKKIAKSANMLLSIDIHDFLPIEKEVYCIVAGEEQPVKKKLVLVFDDFERCKIGVIDLLGIINTYVEDKRIKTIVIASEDNIEDEENYKTFKEKVVERTVKLDMEYRRIQQEMIEDYKTETSEYKEFLKKESPKLFQVFEESGSRNLRTFKSCLIDFERVYGLWHSLKLPTDGMGEALYVFAAYLFEVKGGNYKKMDEYDEYHFNFLEEKAEDKKRNPPRWQTTQDGENSKYKRYNAQYRIQPLIRWMIEGEWNEQRIKAALNQRFSVKETAPEREVLDKAFWELSQEIIDRGLPQVLQQAYDGKLTTDDYVALLGRLDDFRKIGVPIQCDVDDARLLQGFHNRKAKIIKGDICEERGHRRLMRDEGETKLTPQEQSLNEEIEKLQDQWPYLMNEIFFIDYLKNPTYERGLAAKSKILVCFNDELLAAFLSAYKKANISEQQEMLTILKEISFRGGAVERDETDTEVTRKNLEKLENALNSEVEHTSDAVKKFYANRHLETVKQIRQKFLNTREM